MTGTNRSNLSYRTILILCVLLGAPLAARSDTLDDSARELASKIVATLPERDEVAIEVRNLSGMTDVEVAGVERIIHEELQNRGIHVSLNGGSDVTVRIALSENVKRFVWSAEIRHGDTSQVVLLAFAKPVKNPTVTAAMPIVLHSEKFWEGPEHILDAAIVVTPTTDRWLVLLVPEGLLVRRTDGGPAATIQMDSFETQSRSPAGTLLGTESPLKVLLGPNICTVALDPPSVRECEPSPNIASLTMIPGRGQVTGIRSGCGAGNQVLASGAGDYTQADTIQAFEGRSRTAVAVSDEVSFPGPVSFHSISNFEAPSATAVVRNLLTGNYEAYRLSISCAQ